MDSKYLNTYKLQPWNGTCTFSYLKPCASRAHLAYTPSIQPAPYNGINIAM